MNKINNSHPISVKNVAVHDEFWKGMMEKVRTHVIPYQWEALNDRIEGAAKSYCMQNFRVAAGIEKGEFNGYVFQDSDVAKWIEAVGFSLMWHKDAQLEKIADQAIDTIVAAQQPDGYLNTYYIINGLDKRWTNLKDNHELYCLGHMLEGAVAYYQATGKDKLLNAMIRYIDHVDSVFGPEEHKLKGYPGHEVIEMALIRLYGITKDPKHLNLAKYFIDQRGQSPLYFEQEIKKFNNQFYWENSFFQLQYYQAGQPVREQQTADGHSVRAVYLYSGMADVARLTDDKELFAACERLWNNMVHKRMYITGGIGSSEYGEAFTFDYDLPNDTVYGETCASIGLVLFARRMLEIMPKAEYANIMEKALYNGIISGMSLDGKSFFYVNPLEVLPEASEKDHLKHHVKVQRQKWFGCACCPPNVARLLASLSNYAYTLNEKTVFMHLFMGSELAVNFNQSQVSLKVSTNYPWDENVTIEFGMEQPNHFELAVRIPDWCKNYTINLNGQPIEYSIKDGYLYIDRTWNKGDEIALYFAMPVQIVTSNPKVRENVGKVAVTRGPIVYCLEQEDNGKDLHRVYLNNTPNFKYCYEKNLLDGVVTITADGKILDEKDWDENTLYQSIDELTFTEKTLKFIPYYAWANRTAGEMLVWVKNKL